MKFLVDAQLPAKLAAVLCESGHDAVHTGSLAAGNRTTDSVICDEADSAGRVVVTKDRDFRDSHLLLGTRTASRRDCRVSRPTQPRRDDPRSPDLTQR
ncbi:DUF5615 family PIN-like protein [Gordonia sp. X0973]|uniref:DUF5615 family PIN-like protein n=1 Tax=Gordonia sp. X0973 TaxID=2742602 RepID=UPI000F52BBCC|nr:DUF5615 family PIN-like protein [Gordonia sp. X0973]QKT08871.1 DUF5615 family PIN-like protein [Gordonia sp. X0973]